MYQALRPCLARVLIKKTYMDINFKVYGAGPPLIICHGLFGMLDNWQTLARKWADFFTVYAIDQRNHGRSEHTTDFSYPLLAADLAQFMESQWIYNGFLLGHSMGGKTVMQTALDFPDLVEKLVVVDMGPSENKPGHQSVFEAMRSMPIQELTSRKAAEDHLAQYLPERSTRQFLMKNLSRNKAGGFRWKMNPEMIWFHLLNSFNLMCQMIKTKQCYKLNYLLQ